MVKKPKLKFKRVKKAKQALPEVMANTAASLKPIDTTPDGTLSLEEVPKITNETIAEHREEVLKGARKYIYPLQQSKHRIIVITTTVIVAAIVGLFIYCSLALYRFYQYNTFVYRVSQVIPFPVAKAGGHYVNYENYLYELRHYVHYYESQQQRNFAGADRQQLVQFRKQALENVITAAYVKQLASKYHVNVSNKEVNLRLDEVRAQNRLGSNDKVFADVLRSYWGWSINDFKRSLKQQILNEKVTAAADSAGNQKAAAILAQAKSGADFAALAKQNSDDPATKGNGGDYGFSITKTNPNLPPEVITALFGLKVGEVSNVILSSPVLSNQGPSLQIVKVTGITGNTVTAQHIVINLKDISPEIKALRDKKPSTTYIHL
ncbi:SurA N-terminal domain-containing protein [Candidatus Saccharibacteria bacterium]|nr:SurA N-terminal domain-containing protein [Candidatus Saccharibacteria bacterium]